MTKESLKSSKGEPSAAMFAPKTEEDDTESGEAGTKSRVMSDTSGQIIPTEGNDNTLSKQDVRVPTPETHEHEGVNTVDSRTEIDADEHPKQDTQVFQLDLPDSSTSYKMPPPFEAADSAKSLEKEELMLSEAAKSLNSPTENEKLEISRSFTLGAVSEEDKHDALALPDTDGCDERVTGEKSVHVMHGPDSHDSFPLIEKLEGFESNSFDEEEVNTSPDSQPSSLASAEEEPLEVEGMTDSEDLSEKLEVNTRRFREIFK